MISSQLAMAMPETVQSVVQSHENGPLIATAAQLWIRPGDIVLDVTYGKGTFWSRYRPERLIAHDLELDGVDFRQLPEADGSIDVVIFDPPYIPQGGRETSTLRRRPYSALGIRRWGTGRWCRQGSSKVLAPWLSWTSSSPPA